MIGRLLLTKLEDPSKPLLGPNIWVLKFISLIQTNNKFIDLINLCNKLLLNLLTLSQLIDLCLLAIGDGTGPKDVNHLLTNLKYTLMAFITIVKGNTFLYWQKKWVAVFEYTTAADLHARRNADDYQEKIIKSYTKYSHTLTYAYHFVTIASASIMILTSVIKATCIPYYRDGIRNGTEPFPHSMSVWVPFNKNESPGCWFLICWHLNVSGYGGCVLAGFDSSVLVMMKFFEKYLVLLQRDCSMIYRSNETMTDAEFRARVKDCHTRHNLFLKYSNLFNSILSPVMFVYVLVCSLGLCSFAIQLGEVMTTADKTVNVEFLMMCLIQLGAYCLHSNNVLFKSHEMFYGVYESDWWALDVSKQRSLLLLAGKLRRTVVYNAGPLTSLTLSTFITILRGAYSYYTLLRQ